MADDTPYSKRELDEKYGDIANALSRIEIQTTMTNGRVRKLERWQSYVLGFCAGVSLLVISVLIPLAGIAAQLFSNHG